VTTLGTPGMNPGFSCTLPKPQDIDSEVYAGTSGGFDPTSP
jgi:hypothetical protein